MFKLIYKFNGKEIGHYRTEMECKWRAYLDFASTMNLNADANKLHSMWNEKLNRIYKIIKV
jgi:hypothetical protein